MNKTFEHMAPVGGFLAQPHTDDQIVELDAGRIDDVAGGFVVWINHSFRRPDGTVINLPFGPGPVIGPFGPACSKL